MRYICYKLCSHSLTLNTGIYCFLHTLTYIIKILSFFSYWCKHIFCFYFSFNITFCHLFYARMKF